MDAGRLELRVALEVLGRDVDSPYASELLEASTPFCGEDLELLSKRLVREEVWSAFERFDTDRSGGIDVHELPAALRSLGLDVDSPAARRLLREYDANRSGQLELGQFALLVDRFVPAEVWQAFEAYDLDGSRGLDVDELRAALASLGRDVDSPVAKELLQSYDADESGQLELSEFGALASSLAPAALWDCFRLFAQGGTGLSARQLRTLMRALGIDASEERATQLLEAYDTNSSGQLELLEAAQLLARLPTASIWLKLDPHGEIRALRRDAAANSLLPPLLLASAAVLGLAMQAAPPAIDASLAVVSSAWPARPMEQWLASALLLLVGLPHGAVDHITYNNWVGRGGTVAPPIFYACYVAGLGATAAFFALHPAVAVVLFTLVSAHHWGQSHGSPATRGSPRLTFLGAALIGSLTVGFFPIETDAILRLLGTGESTSHVHTFLQAYTAVGFGGWALLALREAMGRGTPRESLRKEPPRKRYLRKELRVLGSVMALCASSELTWALTCYFCLGHSIDAWQDEFTGHQATELKFGNYYKDALPFTALFLAVAVLLNGAVVHGWLPLQLVLAVVMAGTCPHIALLDWWTPWLQERELKEALVNPPVDAAAAVVENG